MCCLRTTLDSKRLLLMSDDVRATSPIHPQHSSSRQFALNAYVGVQTEWPVPFCVACWSSLGKKLLCFRTFYRHARWNLVAPRDDEARHDRGQGSIISRLCRTLIDLFLPLLAVPQRILTTTILFEIDLIDLGPFLPTWGSKCDRCGTFLGLDVYHDRKCIQDLELSERMRGIRFFPF